MTGLYGAISLLARRRLSPSVRYGVTLLLVAAMTLLRSLAPAYIAPFLLYIPVLLVVSLAFGWGPGALTLALSTSIAAWFYTRDGVLSGAEEFLLFQYAVVGAIMVWVCHALRRSTLQNEATLERLNEANHVLVEKQAALNDANAKAEAARESAEQANRAKSAFLANMSHELRTPLSAIIGYSEMMLEEVEEDGDDAGLAPDMRKIENNARHLLGLINDVLDLSKVESGKMVVYAESFEVEPTLRDLAATVQSLVDRKGNTLRLAVGAELGLAHTDLTKVRQILLNLLSNAAKFTEQGTITLAASREGDRLAFQVSDTGIGMTAEQLGRLFQRFTQADASTTRLYGGTGLGLSLAKALAEMLGGEIRVESEPVRGSTFAVSLPAVYAEPVRAEEVPTPIGKPVGDGADRDLVLVIDDDENQRALMSRFLHREGFRASTAPDGRTGLSMARELKPRAILLDVMMPGVDGWSVLSALKADPGLSDIPVVMVTFVEQRALAASLGATDYVLKPVRWDRFKTVMDRFKPPGGVVLVVDDDADARGRLRTLLERDGWTVREAEHGRDGLDRLAEGLPNLVLLDLTMPVMDGFTFLSEMRARPGCAEIPVVVLTALDLTREDRRRLAGASQVLNKGEITMRALGDRLHRLAESAQDGEPFREQDGKVHP